MTPTLEELGLDRYSPRDRRAIAEALLESVTNPVEKPSKASRLVKLRESFERLAAAGGIQSITDPVAWQREQREDRDLPGRSE